jgi:hypothetical protein
MIPFFSKNSLATGLVIGILVPLATYAVLLLIYELLDTMEVMSDIGFAEDFRIRTLMLIAICSNLIAVQRVRRTYHHDTIRGILFATMVLVMVWFFVFGLKIMND